MKKMFSFMVVAILAAAMLSSCKGKDGNDILLVSPKPVLGTLVSSPAVSAITTFGQSIVSHDTGTLNGSYDIFPGQPNTWDIDDGFTLSDGNDDQFDHALELTVGATTFPYDQTYDELTFYTPIMGSSNGVKVAAVSDGVSMNVTALTGTYSAFLNPTSDSRLQQTLNLVSGTTGTIILSWNDDVSLFGGYLPVFTPNYRVVVRDLSGNELQELYSTTVSALSSQNIDLTAYAGQSIVLSFELHNTPQDCKTHLAIVDDVSVKDNNGAGTERVVNGGFETGTLTGWRTNSPAEIQNMTSGERVLEGLKVKRSFYTVPNKLWGRWVDVFENPDFVTAVTTTVTYYTNLGSDNCGVIYDTPGTNGKAITSWDTTWDDRDIGLVFGLVSSKTYTSNPVLSPDWSVTCTGSEDIYFDRVITVPAGGKVAIVNFIIMDGTDTGLTATNTTAKATGIDAEAAAIVNNFWTDGQYRTGMTQEQIDAIKNF